jgi:hypothetical protein
MVAPNIRKRREAARRAALEPSATVVEEAAVLEPVAPVAQPVVARSPEAPKRVTLKKTSKKVKKG